MSDRKYDRWAVYVDTDGVDGPQHLDTYHSLRAALDAAAGQCLEQIPFGEPVPDEVSAQAAAIRDSDSPGIWETSVWPWVIEVRYLPGVMA